MKNLIEFIKKIYKKYKEIILYLIFGVLTTIVSLGSKYILLFVLLDAKDPLQLQISIILSWMIAVIFAYVTNRIFVVKMKRK